MIARMTPESHASDAKPFGAGGLEEGQRVRVDLTRVHWSLPKVAGQLSCEGVRLQRTLCAILDATGHRPFITELRGNEVEIATSFYGEGLLTLRVPLAAVGPGEQNLLGNQGPAGSQGRRDCMSDVFDRAW